MWLSCRNLLTGRGCCIELALSPGSIGEAFLGGGQRLLQDLRVSDVVGEQEKQLRHHQLALLLRQAVKGPHQRIIGVIGALEPQLSSQSSHGLPPPGLSQPPCSWPWRAP